MGNSERLGKLGENIGNIWKYWKTMEKHWKTHGKSDEKTGKNHRKASRTRNGQIWKTCDFFSHIWLFLEKCLTFSDATNCCHFLFWTFSLVNIPWICCLVKPACFGWNLHLTHLNTELNGMDPVCSPVLCDLKIYEYILSSTSARPHHTWLHVCERCHLSRRDVHNAG